MPTTIEAQGSGNIADFAGEAVPTLTGKAVATNRNTRAMIETGFVHGAVVDWDFTVVTGEVGSTLACVVVNAVVACAIVEAWLVVAFVIVITTVFSLKLKSEYKKSEN